MKKLNKLFKLQEYWSGMNYFVMCTAIILLLFLSGCASEKPFALHVHAAQWNGSLTPLPLFEKETIFTIPLNKYPNFVGFWVALYTPTSGEINCFIKEFYDGRNTFNRTAFLVPLEIHPQYQGDTISTGFITSKIKPKQIEYQAMCTRGNETLSTNYTIYLNYPTS